MNLIVDGEDITKVLTEIVRDMENGNLDESQGFVPEGTEKVEQGEIIPSPEATTGEETASDYPAADKIDEPEDNLDESQGFVPEGAGEVEETGKAAAEATTEEASAEPASEESSYPKEDTPESRTEQESGDCVEELKEEQSEDNENNNASDSSAPSSPVKPGEVEHDSEATKQPAEDIVSDYPQADEIDEPEVKVIECSEPDGITQSKEGVIEGTEAEAELDTSLTEPSEEESQSESSVLRDVYGLPCLDLETEESVTLCEGGSLQSLFTITLNRYDTQRTDMMNNMKEYYQNTQLPMDDPKVREYPLF